MGIFGGAFDPPHLGHIALAQAAVEQLQLDALHIVPTGSAWHKDRPLSHPKHRLEMCRLAFADIDCAVVDDCETLRPGPSYTMDTLELLRSRSPEAQFFLLCFCFRFNCDRDNRFWKLDRFENYRFVFITESITGGSIF